jgi:Uma2 family endonuclease
MQSHLRKRLITADEYERMGEASVFPPNARLELLAGEIFQIPSVSPLHAGVVTYLGMLLHRASREWIVSIHNPIRLDGFSEPQPDVTLLRWREDFYRGAHPTPTDVLLVVEVADTTVFTDRTIKIPLYARAGISEVWLVNLPDEQIEIYTKPAGETYESVAQFGRGERTQSPTVAGLSVSVSELFG